MDLRETKEDGTPLEEREVTIMGIAMARSPGAGCILRKPSGKVQTSRDCTTHGAAVPAASAKPAAIPRRLGTVFIRFPLSANRIRDISGQTSIPAACPGNAG
jgi:hypothetical protein